MTERTLSIVKPDAVSKNNIGAIVGKLEASGLRVVASKMIHLDRNTAGEFYGVHKEKPFYNDLMNYMTSGPIVVQVLEGEDAITVNRETMGATNPEKAAPGTIRAEFGTDVTMNAVHGSDAQDTAKSEVSFFFSEEEICTPLNA
ncbi:MAG: nucleoside-diphosphate kinase [Pseudomonadota bacterium]